MSLSEDGVVLAGSVLVLLTLPAAISIIWHPGASVWSVPVLLPHRPTHPLCSGWR